MATKAHTGIPPAERARLAALLAQATPGPWSVDVDRPDEGELVITIPQIERTLHHPEWAQRSERRRDMANARLIVAAVNSLPALLAALDAAEAHVHDALERVGALTRERDEVRQDALNAEREGQMAVRALREIRNLVASEVDVRDGTDGPRPNLAMEVLAVVDAALPITDAEEVVRG